MSNQDHVFVAIDLVNGKPDCVAAARTDRKGAVLGTFSDAINVSEDFPALTRRMASAMLDGHGPEYVVVAHHPEIERVVLAKSFEAKKGRKELFEGRVWIATSQLVWPLVDANMIPSASFETACAYFQISLADRGGLDAERRCSALMTMFFELMRRYRAALIVEEAARDFAGPVFDKMRRMVGL